METIPNYPKKDGKRNIYVRYPVTNGKTWRAADVLQEGYINPFENAGRADFKTEAECEKACDGDNKLWGWTKKQAMKIVGTSIKNSMEEREKTKPKPQTKKQCIEKYRTMKKDLSEYLDKEFIRLLNSGGIDVESYENTFEAPKIILSVVLSNASLQYRSLSGKNGKTEKNLRCF